MSSIHFRFSSALGAATSSAFLPSYTLKQWSAPIRGSLSSTDSSLVSSWPCTRKWRVGTVERLAYRRRSENWGRSSFLVRLCSNESWSAQVHVLTYAFSNFLRTRQLYIFCAFKMNILSPIALPRRTFFADIPSGTVSAGTPHEWTLALRARRRGSPRNQNRSWTQDHVGARTASRNFPVKGRFNKTSIATESCL